MTPDISLIGVTAVCKRCGFSRPTLYRMLKADRFPAPCYPGGMKSPRWRSDVVTAWIERESEPSAPAAA